MQAVIETSKLTKKFGDLIAVDKLTLSVNKGEVLSFLGPNGAGKTTTIRMLAGVIAPTSGEARVAGILLNKELEGLHECIGLLTENPGFYERLTAAENLNFFARFYSGIDVNAQVSKYFALMGLTDRANDKVGRYSKGMKQRLALARAMLHEPRILFLDEPTAGLDPEAAREVRELIRQLKSQGRTIFLCTHNLEEAEELSDRIALFNTRLIALDKSKNLRRRLFDREVVVELETLNERILKSVRMLAYVKDAVEKSGKLAVKLLDFDKNRPLLIEAIVKAGGKVKSFYEAEHSLEEVYLSLMEESKDTKDGSR